MSRPLRAIRRMGSTGARVLALAALAAAAPAGAARPTATVTAVIGDAGAGGVALERESELADGDSLQTGEDGACSILVDGDALLEMCQATSLRFGHRDAPRDGPRVLELRSGEIRVVAAKRPSGRRIEIHTPSAIATVQGSVVYVAVDAKGTTTIASAESNVRVESSRRLGRVLTLTAGQQVTVRPGSPVPRVAEVWDPGDSPADGCLIDFHAVAFDSTREPGDGRALDAVVGQDLVGALPPVAAGREEPRWESPLDGLWIDPKLHEVYDEIDTGAVPPP